MEETQTTQSEKSKTPVALLLLVVVIFVVGGYFFLTAKKPETLGAMTKNTDIVTPSVMPRKMGMKPGPAPTLTELQNQQLASETATTTTQKTFNLSAGNFYFAPNKITVNKGDTVTFIVSDQKGFHNIVIDELNVKSETIETGDTTTVTFTADKIGSYVYYCAIPRHKQLGMWGTLIVK